MGFADGVGLGLERGALGGAGFFQGVGQAGSGAFQGFEVGEGQFVQHFGQIAGRVGGAVEFVVESAGDQQQRIGGLQDVAVAAGEGLAALRPVGGRGGQVPELDFGVDHFAGAVDAIEGVEAGVQDFHHAHLDRPGGGGFGGGVSGGEGVEGGGFAGLGEADDGDVHLAVPVVMAGFCGYSSMSNPRSSSRARTMLDRGEVRSIIIDRYACSSSESAIEISRNCLMLYRKYVRIFR